MDSLSSEPPGKLIYTHISAFLGSKDRLYIYKTIKNINKTHYQEKREREFGILGRDVGLLF